jgi:hypothetical protein
MDLKNLDSMFDPKNLRKPQDPRLSTSALGGKSNGFPLTLEARKPRSSEFVRVRNGEDYQIVTPLLLAEGSKRREDTSLYFLHPEFQIPSEVSHFVRDYQLAAAMTYEGAHFLFATKVNDTEWYDSMLEAMALARERWVHIIADKGLNRHVTEPAVAMLEEPEWPDVSFQEYLQRAFGHRVINSIDHPIMKKLRGA